MGITFPIAYANLKEAWCTTNRCFKPKENNSKYCSACSEKQKLNKNLLSNTKSTDYTIYVDQFKSTSTPS